MHLDQYQKQIHEFYCYLKTKKGRFKKHYMSVDNEQVLVSFYRKSTDTQPRQQHDLSECHIRIAKPQQISMQEHSF